MERHRTPQEVSPLPPLATAEDNGATVDIDPASPVELTGGATTLITITVTAEDGATTSEYMVNVYRQREELSEDATLSALSVSDGALSPLSCRTGWTTTRELEAMLIR